MIHHFDHRYATYEADGTIRDTTLEEHQDPTFQPMPRYWVEETEVDARLVKQDSGSEPVWAWTRPWLLAFRRIARSTDERTAIFSFLPRTGTGDPLPVIFLASEDKDDAKLFLALASTFVFDFVARQAVGGTHLDLFLLKQLPMPAPTEIAPRARSRLIALCTELIEPVSFFDEDTDRSGSPEWDSQLRRDLRTELDALGFEVFGIDEADACHILDSFEVLAKRDLGEHSQFITRDEILARLADS